ncbi:MAG: DUF1836 domain-containing protein [Peptoniphilaceae bacterium]|nr:DUF1836 domain-containing protein [Peptoniphilaceae bacterium]MDD7383494.1 DUF1836 domain-containing protein [Peptoniphilaceae bacterium]MDY3738667.1 DUF1836 domain-containing protein [Peptoniphilaceae bacterium]
MQISRKVKIPDGLKNFKLERWSELPDFGIYKDQLVTIIKENLKPIYLDDEDFISPSMINNYVKLNRIKPPVKKKYFKEQIAVAMIITGLKQVLTLDDISSGISLATKIYSHEQAYNIFCELFENNIKQVFMSELDDIYLSKIADDGTNLSINMITLSLCMKIYTQLIIKEGGIGGINE